jgi:hypothetical protein
MFCLSLERSFFERVKHPNNQYAEMAPQMAVAHFAHFPEVWFGAQSTTRYARKTTRRKNGHNGQ